jgi:hypothetical protein
MTGLQHLNQLATAAKTAKYATVPAKWIPASKYSDKTANALTNCIIDFLNISGHHAERISVIGREREGRFIPSTMQKGTADISATIAGRSVKIEVKIGADIQSEYQRIYQQQIQAAGGVYILAKSFEQFFYWYNQFITNG